MKKQQVKIITNATEVALNEFVQKGWSVVSHAICADGRGGIATSTIVSIDVSDEINAFNMQRTAKYATMYVVTVEDTERPDGDDKKILEYSGIKAVSMEAAALAVESELNRVQYGGDFVVIDVAPAATIDELRQQDDDAYQLTLDLATNDDIGEIPF